MHPDIAGAHRAILSKDPGTAAIAEVAVRHPVWIASTIPVQTPFVMPKSSALKTT